MSIDGTLILVIFFTEHSMDSPPFLYNCTELFIDSSPFLYILEFHLITMVCFDVPLVSKTLQLHSQVENYDPRRIMLAAINEPAISCLRQYLQSTTHH